MGNQLTRSVAYEAFCETPVARYHLKPDEAAKTYTTPDDLLKDLNRVFGTKLDKSYSGLAKVLNQMIEQKHDLGAVYARLRVLWPFNAPGHSEKPARNLWAGLKEIEKRIEEHEDVRRKTDRTIRNAAAIHPRRIWDLFAYRVIPYEFSCLPYKSIGSAGDTQLPNGVPEVEGACVDPFSGYVFGARARFALSHSWVRDLKPTDTPVNSHEWPVPLPSDITLERVREELLGLGAEYIWLDILCLRQTNGPSHLDDLRKPEWAVDVPTIGFIYRHADFVVRYMNGLGREFRRTGWKDEKHWSQRAWTLQEDAGQTLIDVGESVRNNLDQRAEDDPDLVLSDLLTPIKPSVDLEVSPRSVYGYTTLMAKRAASNQVDRIAGLASLLGCENMPTYLEDEAAEDAWLRLLDCIPTVKRLCIITQSPFIGEADSCCSWHPTWAHVMRPSKTDSRPKTYSHSQFRHKVYIMEKARVGKTPEGSDSDFPYEVKWNNYTLEGLGVKGGVIVEGEYTLVAEPRNHLEDWLPIASAWGICEVMKDGALKKVGNFRGRTIERGFKEACSVKDVTFA